MKLALAILVLLGHEALAQKVTISGYIQDSASSERLIGANVYDAATYTGTTSNVYGFYSLTLPRGMHTIVASFVGYKSVSMPLNLTADTMINFNLQQSLQLQAVEITETRKEQIHEKSQMSSVDIPMEQINSLPVLLGERDVLKVVQLLPGVHSGGEGTTGFYVRGGGPDQNLVLLDGVPVYNASHLFGFFSVFNTDAINSVTLIKGGFPARYGGRLSSVLDIRMKEGNMKEFKGEGSVGIVASKLTLEGPIIKDKTSFIVSGRRTYIDVLAKPFIKRGLAAEGNQNRGTAGYYFYDLNGKINHIFNEKHRLYLSAYTGDDKAYARFKGEFEDNGSLFKHEDETGLGWGNITTALRWNYLMSSKVFTNLTATYSRYRFYVGQDYKFEEVGVSNQHFKYDYTSGIRDWALRYDVDYLPSPAHSIKFGAGSTYHRFTPGVNTFFSKTGTSVDADTTFGLDKIDAYESFLFVEDDIKIGTRFKVNAGLHLSSFIVENSEYWSLQPRISGRYLITEKLSAKASAVSMTQYLHLLTNSGIGLPTDLWVPVTDTVKPLQSQQVAAGLAYTFKDRLEFSVEGYYKTMNNLIEYKEGATYFGTSESWQQKVEFGDGYSYGAEFLLQKKEGKFTGWVGYTLSWSIRQFDNLNFGEPFPYRYDRRHDIGIALTYKFNEKVDVGGVFVYGTGNAITLPVERYLENPETGSYWFGGEIQNFDSRNGFRMPSYHRLDLGVNFHKKTRWGERTWSVGVYNTYNRRNPFYLFNSYDESGKRVMKMYSLFPILPSVNYSFRF